MFNQEKRGKREVMKKKTLFWLIFFLVLQKMPFLDVCRYEPVHTLLIFKLMLFSDWIFPEKDAKWEKKRTIWLILSGRKSKGIYWFTQPGGMEELVSCIYLCLGPLWSHSVLTVFHSLSRIMAMLFPTVDEFHLWLRIAPDNSWPIAQWLSNQREK